jgi:hypothetical protein
MIFSEVILFCQMPMCGGGYVTVTKKGYSFLPNAHVWGGSIMVKKKL